MGYQFRGNTSRDLYFRRGCATALRWTMPRGRDSDVQSRQLRLAEQHVNAPTSTYGDVS